MTSQWLITEFKGRTNGDEVEKGHSCSGSEDDDVVAIELCEL